MRLAVVCWPAAVTARRLVAEAVAFFTLSETGGYNLKDQLALKRSGHGEGTPSAMKWYREIGVGHAVEWQ